MIQTFEELVEKTLSEAQQSATALLSDHKKGSGIIDGLKSLAKSIEAGAAEECLASVIELEVEFDDSTDLRVRGLATLLKGLVTFISQNIDSWEDLVAQQFDDKGAAVSCLNEAWLQQSFVFTAKDVTSYYFNLDSDLFASLFSDKGLLSDQDAVVHLWLTSHLFSALPNEAVASLLIAPLPPMMDDHYREIIRLQAAGIGIKCHMSHTSDYVAVANAPKLDTWLDYNKDYSQFSALVSLISESNAYSFSLDKFLRKYQVLEEIMFRQALIKVMSRVSGPTISLRQWKMVSDGMADKEKPTFMKLIAALYETSRKNHCPAFSETKDLWTSFFDFVQGHPKKAEIESQVNELFVSVWDEKPTLVRDLFDTDDKGSLLARMIYAFRCSVVHNKASEFFLSSQTYNAGTGLLFDKFLLPVLDYLVLFGVSHPESGSRYRTKEVSLW